MFLVFRDMENLHDQYTIAAMLYSNKIPNILILFLCDIYIFWEKIPFFYISSYLLF